MATLISTVRGMANAGTAEWTVAGTGATISYWDDTEIERVLDRHKIEYVHADMQPVQSYSGGSIVYTQYRANVTDIESGTDLFKIEDTSGTVTGYTFDYASGVATFTADQGGKSLWWSGYAYGLNAAAADIWRLKASHAAEMVDWSTDGHNVKRSQQVSACLNMATYYQSRSSSEGVSTAKVTRDDL
jgi:hypothetical protein